VRISVLCSSAMIAFMQASNKKEVPIFWTNIQLRATEKVLETSSCASHVSRPTFGPAAGRLRLRVPVYCVLTFFLEIGRNGERSAPAPALDTETNCDETSSSDITRRQSNRCYCRRRLCGRCTPSSFFLVEQTRRACRPRACEGARAAGVVVVLALLRLFGIRVLALRAAEREREAGLTG